MLTTVSLSTKLGVCIGPGPDRPGPKTEFGAGCRSRTGPVLDRTGPGNAQTGPDRSRTGLLLSNSAALQTCTVAPEIWHGCAPSVSRHSLPVPHGTTVPPPSRKKNKKNLLKFGPPIQPGTRPKIEFSKITNRRPDQRGPVQSGPVSDRKLHRPKQSHPRQPRVQVVKKISKT